MLLDLLWGGTVSFWNLLGAACPERAYILDPCEGERQQVPTLVQTPTLNTRRTMTSVSLRTSAFVAPSSIAGYDQ